MYVCECVCVCVCACVPMALNTVGVDFKGISDYLEIVTYFFLFLVLGNRHTPSRQFRAIYTAMSSLYGSSRSSCLLSGRYL